MPYLRIGAGEPLVLIHGLGEIKESWVKQFELADSYDLIIPDLRGHGKNQRFDLISMQTFAEDVISLLQELNIPSAHICGFSMGGAVAQEVYQQAPERCHSLLLISSFHYTPRYFNKFSLEFRKVQSLCLSPEQQKVLAARQGLYSWSHRNIEDFIQYYQPNEIGIEHSLNACSEVDNRLLLPKIKVPTLITGCQYDTILPVGIQISMYKQVPHANLVIFKNAGHLAKIEIPEKFNQTLRDFLSLHNIEEKTG